LRIFGVRANVARAPVTAWPIELTVPARFTITRIRLNP